LKARPGSQEWPLWVTREQTPDGKAGKGWESRRGRIWFWCVMKADRPRVWNMV